MTLKIFLYSFCLCFSWFCEIYACLTKCGTQDVFRSCGVTNHGGQCLSLMGVNWMSDRVCQGTTHFLLQNCLGFLPTPTSDTFSILWTLTASQFWRHFGVLPIPSPFQQSPTLPHAPSTPTPHLTPSLKAALRPLPLLRVAQRSLRTPHPPIQTPLQCSSKTLQATVEIGQLLRHPILRVELLK